MSHHENNNPLANLAALAILFALAFIPYLFPTATFMAARAFAWLLIVAAALIVAWGFVYAVIVNVRHLLRKP